ncbi:MAG TPA: LuxR C-terminal-related transcriptional regulator [Candidatus Dormibacteraeota bacterium]|nr:LuxR C-terminal-related transcriptional regulator [Candidatus Dormibacteraeota bacterium]
MAKPARRTGNLPAESTSFVGRRRELAELKKKLTAVRAVSLVGPGGVGKTRLALRVATDVNRAFRNGAWLVELADVRDPALVANAVIASPDLRDQASAQPLELLAGYLRDKQMLLVIDNCEHVLEAAAELVDEVLKAAPDVRVIATSREPLSVGGEHVLPVAPLELPGAHDAEPVSRLQQNESVMLFVERAAAATGSFELTESNRTAVADLCRRLDGLPLAIELAAVRTRALTVEQILERLGDRFALLVGGGRAALTRHQTLRTAIDWSHDLLTTDERVLLRRLCAFAGRFTLEDVEGVCVSSGALDLLSSLVDKSLVIKEDARSVAAYRLHESMREYAAEKMREAGEHAELERCCIDYYVARCQAMALSARYRLPEWLAWMDLEIDNIRTVLRRCLETSGKRDGIVLATSLSWFWITRATTEGVRWLEELLALPGRESAELPTLAWTYFIRGFLGVLQGDWAVARPALERSIATAREAQAPVQLAHALAMASIAASMAGDRPAAGRLLDDAITLAEEVDDVSVKVGILQARALNAAFEGELETLKAVATEGAMLAREAGDLYSLHMMLLNRGSAAMYAGELSESKSLFAEALRIAYLIDDRIGQFYLLAAFGYHAAIAGQFRVAAQLLGASETIRLGAGATVIAIPAPFIAQAEESAAAGLGQVAYRAQFDAGKSMARDAAVRLALGEAKPTAAPAPEADDGVLGKRETAVAGLVAEGLSNKQIGARLFISERTVDSHVRNILNKLGFNSRAQIAGWFSSQHAVR